VVVTVPIYDKLVRELGDVPKDVGAAAEQILRDLERDCGLSRRAIQQPSENGQWFG